MLLVIFIITTPQLSNDLEMNLPTGQKNKNPNPPPKINQILVDNTGHVLINNQEVQTDALKPTLASMKAADPEMSVVVRGGGDVDYQRVITVLDALQQVDITKIGLATDTAQ